MIQITADTRRAVVTNKELLTVGSAGIQVEFTLSEDWDALSKLAVFRVGDDGAKVDVVLDESLICVVPPEVLKNEDEVLFIGIYGTNGQGTVIIPTVWASAGVVKPGTEPETPASAEPTPEIWAQILGVANDAEQTATEAMSAVEAGLQDLSALEGNVETAEAQRVANEQGRVSAEQQRAEAENIRVLAETGRTDAETARVASEQGRVAAEAGRVWKNNNFLVNGVSVTTLAPSTPATASLETTTDSTTGETAVTRLLLSIPQGAKGDPGDPGDPGETGNGIQSITKTGTSGNVDTYTITYTNGQTATFTVTNGAVSSVAGKTGAVTLDANDVAFSESGTYDDGTVGKELFNQKNAIDAKAPVIINTASGNVASFADGADGGKIRKIVGTIVPQQSGIGDPSPDNVRPISGWTGAIVKQTARNMMDGNAVKQTIFDTLPTTLRGEDPPGWVWYKPSSNNSIFKVPFEPNTQYTFIGDFITQNDNNYVDLYVLYTDGTYTILTSSMFVSTYTVTSGANTYTAGRLVYTTAVNKTVLSLNCGVSTTWASLYYSTFGCYKGIVTLADREEYRATTLPINWQTEAGTIYGGTVTLNEDGSADVVDYMGSKYIIDGTQAFENIRNKTDSGGNALTTTRFPISQLAPNLPVGVNANAFCSVAKRINVYYAWQNQDIGVAGEFAVNNNYMAISVPGTYADRAALQSYFESNQAEVVYEKKNKASYHFGNIGSLLTYYGQNNIWIDTGAITECDYPADTKLYIDGLTAPDEDMIANANIASGKYFVVNNQLYLSTAAIAAGASIVPGTNCTATNLAEALNALNT